MLGRVCVRSVKAVKVRQVVLCPVDVGSVKAVMVSHDGSVELKCVYVCYVLAVKVERVMLRLRGVGKLSFGQAVKLSYVLLRCVSFGCVMSVGLW